MDNPRTPEPQDNACVLQYSQYALDHQHSAYMHINSTLITLYNLAANFAVTCNRSLDQQCLTNANTVIRRSLVSTMLIIRVTYISGQPEIYMK